VAQVVEPPAQQVQGLEFEPKYCPKKKIGEAVVSRIILNLFIRDAL
jgi:hypothetical protein